MKLVSGILLIPAFIAIQFSFIDKKKKPKVLVFSKTAAFVHTSIPEGIAAIQKLGIENDFETDTTKDASIFTSERLKKYAAVIFLNTTGDVLNEAQQAAFEKFIKAGGGFVGVHSATDTEYGWEWYGKLVGAYFKNHPKPQNATLFTKDNTHISTKHLPASWQQNEEWYNFKNIEPGLHYLIVIDENSYTGGTHGNDHPISWYHAFDGGRSFYTALGHLKETYSDPAFLKHLLGGIQYAIKKK